MAFLGIFNFWSTPTPSPMEQLRQDLTELLDPKKGAPDEISSVAQKLWPIYHGGATLSPEQFQKLCAQIKQLKIEPTTDLIASVKEVVGVLKLEDLGEKEGVEEEGVEDWIVFTTQDQIEKDVGKASANRSKEIETIGSRGIVKSTLLQLSEEETKRRVAEKSATAKASVAPAPSKPAVSLELHLTHVEQEDLLDVSVPARFVDGLLKDPNIKKGTEHSLKVNGEKLKLQIPDIFWKDCYRSGLRVNSTLIYNRYNLVDLFFALLAPNLSQLITEQFIETIGNTTMAQHLMRLVTQDAASHLAILLFQKYTRPELNFHSSFPNGHDKVFNIDITSTHSPLTPGVDSKKDWIKIRHDNLFALLHSITSEVYYYYWGFQEILISQSDLLAGTTKTARTRIWQSPLFKTREEAEEFYKKKQNEKDT